MCGARGSQCSPALFTQTIQYFYTDISAISVTFCNSGLGHCIVDKLASTGVQNNPTAFLKLFVGLHFVCKILKHGRGYKEKTVSGVFLILVLTNYFTPTETQLRSIQTMKLQNEYMCFFYDDEKTNLRYISVSVGISPQRSYSSYSSLLPLLRIKTHSIAISGDTAQYHVSEKNV